MGGTLPRGFFEDLYVKSRDPFDFETSAYEAAKHQHTVATLPQAHYKQAVEIGCSIGVLTRDWPRSVTVCWVLIFRSKRSCEPERLRTPSGRQVRPNDSS